MTDTRIPGAILLALGTGIVALVAAGLPEGIFGGLFSDQREYFVVCMVLATVPYAAAVWLVQARPLPRWAMPAVLVLGLAARLIVIGDPPLLSTDLYRYVWDGRVQAAGINPYRYIPNDPALIPLRDTATGPTAIYPNINRVDVARTIYPPAAQALFALVGQVAPTIWGIKTTMLAFDMLTAGLAVLMLRAARLPLAQVLVWTWNPLVIWEFAANGHIDAAAHALSAAALLAAIYARPGWAGAALGVAFLVKFLPAALFPAIWRRWNWRTPLAAAAVILAGYACYASAGALVIGFLPGYAVEEELAGGDFLSLRLIALAILAGLAARIALRPPLPTDTAIRARLIGRDALMLSAALMAVIAPHYPWYYTIVLMPAVLLPAWSALWLSVCAEILYARYWPWTFAVAFPLLALDFYFRRPRSEGRR